MKTLMPKKDDITRDWYLIDLEGQILGRVASKIAQILMGKHKPGFTYHLDIGDWVVATNSRNIRVTGKKRTDKLYQHYTGYPGGLKEATFEELMAKDPRLAVKAAVKGMLPKNKLRDKRLKRLKIFPDEKHNVQGKKLIPLNNGNGEEK